MADKQHWSTAPLVAIVSAVLAQGAWGFIGGFIAVHGGASSDCHNAAPCDPTIYGAAYLVVPTAVAVLP